MLGTAKTCWRSVTVRQLSGRALAALAHDEPDHERLRDGAAENGQDARVPEPQDSASDGPAIGVIGPAEAVPAERSGAAGTGERRSAIQERDPRRPTRRLNPASPELSGISPQRFGLLTFLSLLGIGQNYGGRFSKRCGDCNHLHWTANLSKLPTFCAACWRQRDSHPLRNGTLSWSTNRGGLALAPNRGGCCRTRTRTSSHRFSNFNSLPQMFDTSPIHAEVPERGEA